MQEDWAVIGKVRSVNPQRRELRVAPAKAYAHAFPALQRVWVVEHGERLRCRVSKVREAAGFWVLTLPPGVPRDVIGRIGRVPVEVPRAEIAEKAPSAWELDDLLGLAVCDEQEQELGTVVEVMETPAHDIFVVAAPRERWLLPAIPEVIQAVDVAGERMIVGDVTPYVVVEPMNEEAREE